MKRIFAILVSVSMLLSLGAVAASATEIFEPAGDVEIAWLTEDQVDSINFDGELGDWVALDLPYKTIDKTNLITWEINNQPGSFDMPEVIADDFAINAYFAADPNYLYVAFFIVDDQWALSDNPANYTGDAFQISVDWNSHMEHALNEGADYSNNKNVFYSFSCEKEGDPLQISIREGFKDRVISEAASENQEVPDMKGCAGAYEGGWCAEFCLAWNLLYGDYEYKTWEATEDYFNADSPLTLGLQICYINRSETAGPVVWAAGTFNNDTDYPTWEPTTNGLYATLNWEEGREIICNGIINGNPPAGSETTEIAGGDESETEEIVDVTETEVATEVVTEVETEAETTKAADTEAATTKADDKTEAGCKSVVGTAGALALVAVMAAGVVIRKKD